MRVQINFRSRVPIYLQIVEQVKHQVASGELKTGDQLPTVRQLAEELRVNFNTVARAYRLLDEAGIISTQHGRGTYIWEKPSEETARQMRSQALQNLVRRYLAEADRLGSSPEELASVLAEELSRGVELKAS